MTVVCAIGILACGACFLPPPRQTLPPPPRIDLRGSRDISVVVTNVSETHHIDADAFGRWIADAINEDSGPSGPKAHGGGKPNPGEAVLQISIKKESAESRTDTIPPALSVWTLSTTIDAMLLAADGTVVLHLSNDEYRSNARRRASDSQDIWRSQTVESWLRYYVARNFAPKVLFGNP